MFANPKEFRPLEVRGTVLENITKKGILRVYEPEIGMYVYQYERELYWIADSKYEFEEEDTTIQYHMYTTQIQNLPKERLENNWLWSNLSFKFSTNELMSSECGSYRVTKYALPKEYSISNIWTGKYDDDWVWKVHFRPRYDFMEGEK